MLFIVLTMLLSLALAAGIGLYVAFPHRGEDVPRASWLGQAMRKGVESLPTLEADGDAITEDLSELVRYRTGK